MDIGNLVTHPFVLDLSVNLGIFIISCLLILAFLLAYLRIFVASGIILWYVGILFMYNGVNFLISLIPILLGVFLIISGGKK